MNATKILKENASWTDCPLDVTMSVLSNKWKCSIINVLFDGKIRFLELQRRLGTVSPKVLTSTLNLLIEDNIIEKIDYNTKNPRVEYQLTNYGQMLQPLFIEMRIWGSMYQSEMSK